MHQNGTNNCDYDYFIWTLYNAFQLCMAEINCTVSIILGQVIFMLILNMPFAM